MWFWRMNKSSLSSRLLVFRCVVVWLRLVSINDGRNKIENQLIRYRNIKFKICCYALDSNNNTISRYQISDQALPFT